MGDKPTLYELKHKQSLDFVALSEEVLAKSEATLAPLLDGYIRRAFAENLVREKTLVFPKTLFKRGIDDICKVLAVDSHQNRPCFTSKEREDFGLFLECYQQDFFAWHAAYTRRRLVVLAVGGLIGFVSWESIKSSV